MPSKKRRRNKPIDVASIEGLQNLLHDSVIDHSNIKERDLQHVRVGVSAVNAGRGLLNTRIKIEQWEAIKATAESEAA